MTTEYSVSVDRAACEGVFACLVRDDRFVEAADGLAGVDETAAESVDGDGDVLTATFGDDRIDAARSAAAACPVDAIAVAADEGGPVDE